MSVISGSLASTISHVAAAQASASQSAAQNTSDSFGPATTVNLSAAAQSIVSGQSSGSGASAPAAPPAGGASGGGIPIATTTSSTTDTALLIEEALQQVIPKVGIANASEVVDDKGNINTVKLNQLILQQDQATTARQSA